jgi:hypothetical protein
MKVLFLDVDGVLNSYRSVVCYGGFSWPNNHSGGPKDQNNMDWIAVGMIRKACAESGAVI